MPRFHLIFRKSYFVNASVNAVVCLNLPKSTPLSSLDLAKDQLASVAAKVTANIYLTLVTTKVSCQLLRFTLASAKFPASVHVPVHVGNCKVSPQSVLRSMSLYMLEILKTFFLGIPSKPHRVPKPHIPQSMSNCIVHEPGAMIACKYDLSRRKISSQYYFKQLSGTCL